MGADLGPKLAPVGFIFGSSSRSCVQCRSQDAFGFVWGPFRSLRGEPKLAFRVGGLHIFSFSGLAHRSSSWEPSRVDLGPGLGPKSGPKSVPKGVPKRPRKGDPKMTPTRPQISPQDPPQIGSQIGTKRRESPGAALAQAIFLKTIWQDAARTPPGPPRRPPEPSQELPRTPPRGPRDSPKGLPETPLPQPTRRL